MVQQVLTAYDSHDVTTKTTFVVSEPPLTGTVKQREREREVLVYKYTIFSPDILIFMFIRLEVKKGFIFIHKWHHRKCISYVSSSANGNYAAGKLILWIFYGKNDEILLNFSGTAFVWLSPHDRQFRLMQKTRAKTQLAASLPLWEIVFFFPSTTSRHGNLN